MNQKLPDKQKVGDPPNNCDAKNAKDKNHKIYKYFSNSAQHYYRHGYQIPNKYELQIETPSISNTESECLFPSEKLCPNCNTRLKCYENFCIRCQLNFFLKISEKQKLKWNNVKDHRYTNSQRDSNSYSLVCVNCERLYTLCPVCLAKNNVCHDCHQKRNVCMNCRRVLCIHCLDRSAIYGNSKIPHCNKNEDYKQADINKFKSEPQSSFKLLDVEYEGLSSNEVEYDFWQPTHSLDIKNNRKSSIYSSPSLNMDCSSIFYPYNQERQIKQTSAIKSLPIIKNRNYSKLPGSDDNIERLCNETDKSLARYHKNKGNLEQYSQKKIESYNRSTQTTPETRGRRDLVLHEEFNISMPLLREMPKTTRRNYKLKRSISLQRKMDSMIRKLDISK